MTMRDKPIALSLMMLVLPVRLAEKATELFTHSGLPLQYRLTAEGTATSKIMDMLGLGSVDKCLLASMLPKSIAHNMLHKVNTELKLDSVNSGVGFTVSLSGANGMLMHMLAKTESDNAHLMRKEEESVSEMKYAMVATAVERGFAEEVMDAAREVGARGGTVLHSHSLANEEIMNFWGLNIQKEQDIVLILTDAENKLKIMRAISEKFGLHSDAKGLVLSFPIDSVIGLPSQK